jgi:CBS domain-containing protein
MQIRDIMTEDPACCTPETSLQQVALLMGENDCGALPVVDDLDNMKPVGVITDRDIVLRSLAVGKDPFDLKVEDCMSGPPVTATPEDDVEDCCDMMESNQVRRVLVIDAQSRVVGIVAQADIAKLAPKDKVAEVVREISL